MLRTLPRVAAPIDLPSVGVVGAGLGTLLERAGVAAAAFRPKEPDAVSVNTYYSSIIIIIVRA